MQGANEAATVRAKIPEVVLRTFLVAKPNTSCGKRKLSAGLFFKKRC